MRHPTSHSGSWDSSLRLVKGRGAGNSTAMWLRSEVLYAVCSNSDIKKLNRNIILGPSPEGVDKQPVNIKYNISFTRFLRASAHIKREIMREIELDNNTVMRAHTKIKVLLSKKERLKNSQNWQCLLKWFPPNSSGAFILTSSG